MPGGRIPGPTGKYPADIEDGTSCRTESPRPWPLGAGSPAAAARLASLAVYGEDVHDNLTEVLALAAGFGVTEAREIAAANQHTDEDLETTPMPYWTRNRWGIPVFSAGIDRRKLWHFTSEARRAKLKQQYRQSGDMRDLGKYMHALQDSFSHEGLNPVIGQMGTRVDPLTGETRYDSPNPLDQAPWHEADLPHLNPGKAMRMARVTYDELVEAKEYLAGRGKLGVSFDAVDYDAKIAKLVEEFCHQPDKEERKRIAGGIGSVVLSERRRQEEDMNKEIRSHIEELERRGRVRTIPPRRRRPKS